jgi:hypothetical protein
MEGLSTYNIEDSESVSYREIIEGGRELLRETIRDPENEGHDEYTRGVVGLIAEVFGKREMDTSTRMDEVAAEIGVPVSW